MKKHPLHDLAMSEAIKSTQMQRLGAVIFKGKRKILSVGRNFRRTHPLGKHFSPDTGKELSWIHAEVDAVIGCRWYENINGAYIFVARLKRDGTGAGMARPCLICQRILKEYGIKRMYYTTGEGNNYAMENL